MRACQSHLSMRCRSMLPTALKRRPPRAHDDCKAPARPPSVLAALKLRLARRKLCKRRVRIGLTAAAVGRRALARTGVATIAVTIPPAVRPALAPRTAL